MPLIFLNEFMDKATKPKPIKFFMDTGRWGFLSPMYPCPVKVDGITYGSVEHYYQSMKGATEAIKSKIREAPTGYVAKEMAHALNGGDAVKLSPQEKIEVMRKAMLAKFLQNPDLGKKLLATGDSLLLEDSPNDMFWGLNGENWVGKLVTEARDAVRKQKD